MIESTIKALLQTKAAIVAAATGGIHWRIKPQGELRPHLLIFTPAETPEHTLSAPDGYSEGELEIIAFAPAYAQAKALARLVKAGIDGATDSEGSILTVINISDVPISNADGQENPLLHGVTVALEVESTVERP